MSTGPAQEPDLEQQLFGSDDEEDEGEQQISPIRTKDDRKSKIAELAARKAAERQDSEPAEKRPRGHDDGPSGRDGEGRPHYDSENDEEGQATAEDQAFIDDEGADMTDKLFGSESEGEEDAGLEGAPQAEEAEEGEEVDEFEFLQKKAKAARKRRRPDEDEAALTREVELFLSRMEVAQESDVRANQDRKPAIHKLKLVKEMSNKLSQAHLQRKFLEQGVLTVLTHWLSPLPDGSLPNITIRTAILKALQQMPIHVEDPERKDQLKRSGLGRVVMFLYKLDEETPQNRRLAKELVHRWSRPLFALESKHQPSSEQRVQRNPDEAQPRRAQAPSEEVDEDGNPVAKKGPAPGEPGWRWHASIPQASKLDYKVRPEPKFSKESMGHKNTAKAKHEKLDKKLKTMKQGNKQRLGTDRPTKISIEGRGLLH